MNVLLNTLSIDHIWMKHRSYINLLHKTNVFYLQLNHNHRLLVGTTGQNIDELCR